MKDFVLVPTEPTEEMIRAGDREDQRLTDVYGIYKAMISAAPASPAQDDHEFKNFHRMLCERFDYCHDEKDWKRDQVSLMEWIARKALPSASLAQQDDLTAAIQHAEDVANREGCSDCGLEHRQLAGWLKELAGYRAALTAPQDAQEREFAEIVGDTRFEGWLSESITRTTHYIKQDMREAYWAGYQEAKALTTAQPADANLRLADKSEAVTATKDEQPQLSDEEIIKLAKQAGWQNTAILQADLPPLRRYTKLLLARKGTE